MTSQVSADLANDPGSDVATSGFATMADSRMQPDIREEVLRTFTTARLDDEDILAAHALLNLDSRLAAFELVKKHLCTRDAQVIADGPVWS